MRANSIFSLEKKEKVCTMSESTQSSAQKPEFGRLQSMFWPIHKYELKKFLPMSFLMFFILFVYTMVRDLKDSLVRKVAVCGGAELVPQLKLWFVMPAAVLLVILYTFLINKFGFKKTFYIMVTAFMSFYVIFLLFLYPNRNVIHASEATVRALQASWPKFFYWIIPCITNWSFTLFYVLSELWGTMAISSLFWQFAYEVTMKNEVKRFFALYSVIGNIGVFCSGGLLKTVSKMPGDAHIYVSVWVCVAFGIATMLMYSYINSVVLKDPKLYDPSQVKEKKKKGKVGIMDGIKILFKSKYLLMICAIVVCYGVGINFFEVIWKKYTDRFVSGASGVSDMMANLSMTIGVLTILASFIGQNILRKTSWKTSALIPAMIFLIGGGLFFAVVLYGEFVSPNIFGISYLALATWFGLFNDALCKSVKYCLFDATKNMAYLPLDDDTRTKGQAAVEVIGGRAGKAGASTIQMVLMNVIAAGSTLLDHIVTISILTVSTAAIWFASVCNLSKKYEAKLAEQSNAKSEN